MISLVYSLALLYTPAPVEATPGKLVYLPSEAGYSVWFDLDGAKDPTQTGIYLGSLRRLARWKWGSPQLPGITKRTRRELAELLWEQQDAMVRAIYTLT